ncbi:MAG TPA: response regulator transcription factor [Galbitalea sp.]|jgi:DNA-binding response OmpR family regulator
MTRILIAEDEVRISSFVQKGLSAAGYACTVSADGAEALALAQSGEFDLLLLDIGLPSMDGYEILRRFRVDDHTTPVIMLTARDSVEDTVVSLDAGANDYLAKPYKFDELLARIRVRIRERPTAVENELHHGNVSLDLRTRRAKVGGQVVDLAPREFAVVEEFLKHPDQILSRGQLLSRVWGYDFDPGSNVVDVYIRYIRNKFGADFIETVRGAGYRLK